MPSAPTASASTGNAEPTSQQPTQANTSGRMASASGNLALRLAKAGQKPCERLFFAALIANFVIGVVALAAFLVERTPKQRINSEGGKDFYTPEPKLAKQLGFMLIGIIGTTIASALIHNLTHHIITSRTPNPTTTDAMELAELGQNPSNSA